MMKIIGMLIPMLLITSCHMNDPRPENHRANVTTVGDSVCVTSPSFKGEKISSLNISEVGNSVNVLDKNFTVENSPTLSQNKCAPDFGFNFEQGKAYIYSINSVQLNENDTVRNGNSYSVTFSLWMENGVLKATDIN